MLEDLTIVITTYKRYGYLNRLLSFLLSYGSRAKIIVLDSTPYLPEDRSLTDRLASKNIDWKRFDSNTPLMTKTALGVKEVRTEFSVLCADDDFLILSGATKCVEFLRENPEYGSAQGAYFHHLVIQKKFFQGCCITPLYKGSSSGEDDKPLERVMSYLTGNSALPYYAIHRTRNLQIMWEKTAKLQLNRELGELFPCALSMCLGKMKKLPAFYSSREQNNMAIFSRAQVASMYEQSEIEPVARSLSNTIEPTNTEAYEAVRLLILSAISDRATAVNDKMQVRQSLFSKSALAVKNSRWLRVLFKELLVRGVDSSVSSSELSDFFRLKEALLSTSLSANELNAARTS